MSNILISLYNGDYVPIEMVKQHKNDELSKNAAELYDLLSDSLDATQQAILDSLLQYDAEEQALVEQGMYVSGFKDGVRVILTCLSEG